MGRADVAAIYPHRLWNGIWDRLVRLRECIDGNYASNERGVAAAASQHAAQAAKRVPLAAATHLKIGMTRPAVCSMTTSNATTRARARLLYC